MAIIKHTWMSWNEHGKNKRLYYVLWRLMDMAINNLDFTWRYISFFFFKITKGII